MNAFSSQGLSQILLIDIQEKQVQSKQNNKIRPKKKSPHLTPRATATGIQSSHSELIGSSWFQSQLPNIGIIWKIFCRQFVMFVGEICLEEFGNNAWCAAYYPHIAPRVCFGFWNCWCWFRLLCISGWILQDENCV